MSDSFAASVTAWARQSEARLTAVRNRSIDLLAEEMSNTIPNGGRVPFDTGFLARSIVASTQGMPRASQSPSPGGEVGLITASLRLDQPVWLGYTANYARRVNFGFIGADSLGRVYNQSGAHFIEGAIAEWQNIVRRAAAELQNSVESRA